jgi:dTDP-4-dehydrorhamnose reductase
MTRVLVLGGTGMLGHRVARAFAGAHEVHATARDLAVATRAQLPAALHKLDVLDSDALVGVLEQVAPAVVVNCVGIVKQLDAAKQAIPSIRINALFPHELAQMCSRRDIRLVHVSTDCVFSGDLPFPQAYREDDTSDARDLYGRTKFLGEVGAPAITLRTSIVGPELQHANGLLEWLRRQGDAEVQGFRNAWFSGLTTDTLADVIRDVVESHPGLAGVFHVSADPVNKHDLLLALKDALALPTTIRGVDTPTINRVLDSSRFRDATAIQIPTWAEMLDHYERQSHVQTA